MKKFCIITATALIVFGCATGQMTVREVNPRIVYRDLTKPVAYNIIEPQPAAQAEEPEPAGQGAQPQYFVQFTNESYTTFDATGLDGLAEQAKPESLILIVGHSHGSSAVGTLALASKRAETIARHLKGGGYTKVLVMASWGGQTTDFAPNRGVHVYVIEHPDQDQGLPIVIARQVKPGKATPSRDLELAVGHAQDSLKDL